MYDSGKLSGLGLWTQRLLVFLLPHCKTRKLGTRELG